MRKKIVAGNWKMNNDLIMSNNLINDLKLKLSKEIDTEVFISPSFPFLHEAINQCKGTKINVLAQNVNENSGGAYTGEVSLSMLRSIGIDSVLIGHSERREYYHETDEILLKKLSNSLDEGFKVFFCIGESLNERDNDLHFDVIEKQLKNTIFKIDKINYENLIIAYEPVWAIGTGLTASPDQVQEIHAFIRKNIAEKFDEDFSNNISIIYGGSVKPDTASEIFSKDDVDGGLIGGASLNAKDFVEIVNSI